MKQAFRCWGGPIVGETSRDALGEYTLTSMDSLAAWKLLLNDRQIATSEGRYRHIDRMIKRLIGRRLRMFEIEAGSRATRLTFSGGLVLTTSTFQEQLNPPPHWILRLPDSGPKNWPSVILCGQEDVNSRA